MSAWFLPLLRPQAALRCQKLGRVPQQAPLCVIVRLLASEIGKLFNQTIPIPLHDGADGRHHDRRRVVLQPRSVCNAKFRLRSQPLRYKSMLKTTNELADAKLFLQLQKRANVTSRGKGLVRLFRQKGLKDSCRCNSLLCGRKPPGMEVAKMLNPLLRGVLQQSRLKVLHEPAKRTSGFAQDLQNGLVVQYFACSHDTALATSTPHHTPTSPRAKLTTTYNAAMKSSPSASSRRSPIQRWKMCCRHPQSRWAEENATLGSNLSSCPKCEGKADEAGGDIDDKGAVWRPGTHTPGDRRTDPEPGKKPQGAPQRDEEILLHVLPTRKPPAECPEESHTAQSHRLGSATKYIFHHDPL